MMKVRAPSALINSMTAPCGARLAVEVFAEHRVLGVRRGVCDRERRDAAPPMLAFECLVEVVREVYYPSSSPGAGADSPAFGASRAAMVGHIGLPGP